MPPPSVRFLVLLAASALVLVCLKKSLPFPTNTKRAIQVTSAYNSPVDVALSLRSAAAANKMIDSLRTEEEAAPLQSASTPSPPVIQAEEIANQKKLLQLLPCPPLGDSQGNQDCIIEKIFQAIGTTNKYYVEYGFNTNIQCSLSGPNTCRLWKSGTWKGLLLDGSHQNETINLKSHYLYANNIVSILEKYGVPKEPDFYSGDMDSHDYFVMKSVLDSGKFRPRLITTEYNSNYPENDWAISQVDPTIAHPEQEPPPYQFQTCVWGASPAAFRYLMERHGYSLVAVTLRLDLFWIRNDVLHEHGWEAPPYEQVLKGFAGIPLHQPQTNTLFLNKLVDVRMYEETKNYRQANRAAIQTLLQHIRNPGEPTIPCLAGIRPADVEAYLAEQPIVGRHLDIS